MEQTACRFEYVAEAIGGRVSNLQLDHEAVELRLRKRECALEFDRVLRCDHPERVGEGMLHTVVRDLPLLHGLEQCCLGTRCGPVDLIDKHEVGEHRALAKLELGCRACVAQQHFAARDISRKQVRCALHAPGRQIEQRRYRFGKMCLAKTRPGIAAR